jgi:hypothetical protein
MESTFGGCDFGDLRGEFMDISDFEQMGVDLCRTILLYENIYIPPELEHLYPRRDSG